MRQIITIINQLPTGTEKAYDVLGYVYEFLIGQFAAGAGKKSGEFYTPHQVAVVMAEIVAEHLKGRDTIDVYDPTSGSASLLLNIGDSIARRSGDPDRVRYFAQELKQDTYNLTRMNLVMRGVRPANIVTRNADSLAQDWPYIDEHGNYDLLRVDAVVSNPPYSAEWDRDNARGDARFKYGLAPSKTADYAFLLHELYHLKDDGILTIVLPHGVLFRGGEEEAIRRNLIDNNHIETIIGFPPNIFYGTGIATLVMVLKKQRGDDGDVLFVDASKGFIKAGTKNELRARDIRKIVDTVTNRETIEGYSRLVTREEIRVNGYNLNIPRYVDSSETPETYDIYSTMFGGIPNAEIGTLGRYWEALPGLREALFERVSDTHSRVKVNDVAAVVAGHPSAVAFRDTFTSALVGFDAFAEDTLLTDPTAVNPAQAEAALRYDLFERLAGVPIIDPYEVYQLFADTWEVTESDLEVVRGEGFDAVRAVDPNIVTKKVKGKDTEVQDGWVGRVLPFELVQSVLLADLVERVEHSRATVAAAAATRDEVFAEIDEEDYGEGDTLITNAAGTAFAAAGVARRIKALKADTERDEHDDELLALLERADFALKQVKVLGADVKRLELLLTAKTKEAIESLTDEQAAGLLREKWVGRVFRSFEKIVDAELAALVSEVKRLDAKYATTLGDVEDTIRETSRELAGMMSQLRGSESDMAGIAALVEMLGGEGRA
ncbi:type I restriction-modification system subunit M [Corynebacterium aquatimens]|uniref:type I restriction-modification system subunit M n=1 Tax=Corynebacterium aquatimens TaxID=1190508 RepID=UPI002542035B|nr:type I restriction-modification system subunit M [Corynebacterium aquatimens]QYH19028.1 type I restriction-modification system subunit M [Corynebacterium aquatimens]